jgi:hypothetical protein
MRTIVRRVFFGAEAGQVFDDCWKPVLAHVHHELDAQLHTCHDVIGVLIMTRIVGHAQLQMTHAQARCPSPCSGEHSMPLRCLRPYSDCATQSSQVAACRVSVRLCHGCRLPLSASTRRWPACRCRCLRASSTGSASCCGPTSRASSASTSPPSLLVRTYMAAQLLFHVYVFVWLKDC